MRKTLFATAVATILSAGAFLSSGANAMTLTAPAGMRAATEGANAVEQVRHRCYRSRGRLVCPLHRRVVVGSPYYGSGYGYGYPYAYGYGYPYVGVGYGGWWGGGWYGGNRTVVRRTVVRRGPVHSGGGRRHR
jgi:hypothetical protein